MPSNSGFSARQITAYSADIQHPATVYVGVVNDKESGGVFVSHTGGVEGWSQKSGGLDGHDVFSLARPPMGHAGRVRSMAYTGWWASCGSAPATAPKDRCVQRRECAAPAG